MSEPDARAMLNRLLTRDEMLAQGAKRHGDLPADMQEKFDSAAHVVCADCNKAN